MTKLIIVENDVVSNIGMDKHSVHGTNTSSGTPVSVANIFSYDFTGGVKEKSNGNDFVTINGKKIITKGNNECPQTQAHIFGNVTAADISAFSAWSSNNAPDGFGFAPAPAPAAEEPDNNGENSRDAGSSFVKINGTAIILDKDNFDTCSVSGSSNSGRSTTSQVTSSEQDFVTTHE
jgi:hypothetical protein